MATTFSGNTHAKPTLRPALILVTGPQMIGKTALSKRISIETGGHLFDSDLVKKELYGNEGEKIGAPEREKEMMANTYEEIGRRTAISLANGFMVIVAGAQSRQMSYDVARERAKDAGVPLIVVRFDLNRIDDLEDFMHGRLKSRLEKRDAGPTNILSKKDFWLVKETFERYKSLDLSKVDHTITLDPCTSIEEQVAVVVSKLNSFLTVPEKTKTLMRG